MFRICSLFLTSAGLFLRRSNYVRVSSDFAFAAVLLPNHSLSFFPELIIQIRNRTYSSTGSAKLVSPTDSGLTDHPNALANSLFQVLYCNRGPKRLYPVDLATRF
jgi:hypothetical protein